MLDDLVDAAPEGLRQTWERGAAVDHFEQAGLFAEQVLGWSFHDNQLDALGDPGFVHLVDRSAHAHDVVRRGAFHADDDSGCADRVGGDHRAFEDAVGIAAKQLAVFERSGLTFGRVDDDSRVLVGGGVAGNGLPLHAGRKARAAAAADTRSADQVGDRGRLHAARGIETAPTTTFEVAVEGRDGRRIENA